LHEGEVEITTEAGADIITAGKSITFAKTGITSEQELTEMDWQSSIKSLEIDEEGSDPTTEFLEKYALILAVLGHLGFVAALAFLVFRIKKQGKHAKLVKWTFILGFLSILFSINSLLGLLVGVTGIFVFKQHGKVKPSKLAWVGAILCGIGAWISIMTVFVY